MSTLKLLKASRARIALPGNFCQGSMAQNKFGFAEFFESKSACSWCSLGAIAVTVDQNILYLQFKAAAKNALRAEMLGNIAKFSNNHTHAEVLEKWDAAIEKEGAK